MLSFCKCIFGINKYEGLHAASLSNDIKDSIDRCSKCPLIKSIWTRNPPMQDLIWKGRGPDTQLMNVLSLLPMSYFVSDKTRPFFLSLRMDTEGKYICYYV